MTEKNFCFQFLCLPSLTKSTSVSDTKARAGSNLDCWGYTTFSVIKYFFTQRFSESKCTYRLLEPPVRNCASQATKTHSFPKINVHTLTIGWELVPVKHGDTQDILIQVLNEELAVEVPLGVQGVLHGPRCVALRAHADFTVRVALP